MAQFTDGFFLDLAHALAGKVELLTDFVERHRVFAAETVEEFQDFRLALRERVDDRAQLHLQRLVNQGFVGRNRVLVAKHIVHIRVVVGGEAGVHREVFRGILQRIFHLFLCHAHALGDFRHFGFALVLLFQDTHRLVNLVDDADLVHRQAHDARLLGDSLQDGLTDPPYGERDELEALGLIETVSRLDQAEISLVDQVRQGDSLILILFCHRDHETEVCLGEFFQGVVISVADSACQFRLFIGGEQGYLSDVMQIFVQRRRFASVGNLLCNS